MIKTIAYSLNEPDNDSYLNSDLWGKNICECLEYVRNREKYITSDFKIKKANFDFSNTYDGATIVSEKFKKFCKENNLKGLEFYPLISNKKLFLFKSSNIVAFDSERRKTKFVDYNKECSEFNEVAGANPVCLIQANEIRSGIFRTDIEFSGGYAKHPLIIVGTETYTKMQEINFTGLYAEKILNKYDWEEKH